MSDLNTLILHGRIVRDAVFKNTNSGSKLALFTIAVNQTKKNQDGTYSETANFFPVSTFVYSDKFASYLKKGQALIIEGYLKQSKKKEVDESGKTKYISKIYICTSKIHLIYSTNKTYKENMEDPILVQDINFNNTINDLVIETEEYQEDLFIPDIF